MRPYRVLLVSVAAALALATPAGAAGPDPDDVVTVTVTGPIVCVTDPCEQPPYTVQVCVVPAGLCVSH